MGPEWVEQHVISDNRKKGFLSIDESDPHRRELSFFRVMDLAEVIYNLQPVPGFDECIARMRDGDIEGTYAELDFGRMLFLNQVPFRFVVPQGEIGMDYDIEVEYPESLIESAGHALFVALTEPVDPEAGIPVSALRVTIPRARHKGRLAGGTRERGPPFRRSLSLPLSRVPF